MPGICTRVTNGTMTHPAGVERKELPAEERMNDTVVVKLKKILSMGHERTHRCQ